MNFLGDLSENASSQIFRMLQMHADRVRALREEEATSIARAELLEQLTERLLRGDFSAAAAEASPLSSNTSLEVCDSPRKFNKPNISAPNEREWSAEYLDAVSSVCTDEDRKQKEEPQEDEDGEEEEEAEEAEKKDNQHPIISTSQDLLNDIHTDTIEDKIPKDKVMRNGTPSPMRRELDAFFPILATKRPRRTNAPDDMHLVRKRMDITATDILASVPCISSRVESSTIQNDTTIYMNETKSYVRTNHIRQLDYAADEAMHIRDENAAVEVCTPPPYWEIAFPQSRQT
ncbi:uncharacterized protein TM35_000021380 [Trypanosoma theileri]|uniref:Uncharacterized protein n=1 Tax=Trypanosoma theileri TaxID=67003 RepID=A0A1X0P7A9_9TRYP|nr:uncharacterized protein TM35_000021380 [Trypanosoma theileri]ORC92812.1 hypothetical protein TM35_000021380 [Trypanosoma theileri]